MQTLDSWVVTTVAGLIVTFTIYFLKQKFDKVNTIEKGIQEIRDGFVKKSDHEKDMEKLADEVIEIRRDYTPKREHEKAYDELREDLKDVKENFLRKDDFLREISKIDKKMDKIQELIMNAKSNL